MKTLQLTVLSAIEALAFAGALVLYLNRIVRELDLIGGAPTSCLAKIRFGVSAIEKETSHLEPELTRLNSSLIGLVEKFEAVDRQLEATVRNLQKNKELPS